MNRKLLLLATAFLIVTAAFAQKPTLTFKVKEHDFGQVKEEDGKISYVFEFINTGTAPLLIQRVQASCGCTTPDWTKEPVEPGKSGTVTATYNPQGRPGSFTKSITVYSNASNETEVLYIKGTVISSSQPQQAVNNNNLPFQMGGLKYAAKTIQMNNVYKGKSQNRSIAIKNTTGSDLKVDFVNLPSYITAVVTPSVLKPGEDGKIDFNLNSDKASTWGPIKNDIYLVLNGKKVLSDDYKILFLGNISEDFSNVDRKTTPIFEIKSPNVYFGQVTKGKIIRGKIAVKNAGINSLEIRRIVNNNSEIKIHPLTSVKKGKTGELKVDIDAKNLTTGKYSRVFTVQTNDPQNQFVVFNLSWEVK